MLEALRAAPMRMEEIIEGVRVPKRHGDAKQWLRKRLVELEAAGEIARFADGRYGPARL